MKKKVHFILGLFTFLFTLSVRPSHAQLSAQGALGNGNIGNLFITDPTLADHAILSMINISFSIAGLVALGYLLYAGFTYILGRSDRSSIEKAQKTIMHAVIGLIIVMFSYFLALLVASLVGVQGNIFVGFKQLFNSL